MCWLLLLHYSSVDEVNFNGRQRACLVSVWTAGLLDKLLQIILSQFLIQLLSHLPSVLEDAGTIILPTT